MLGTMTGTAMTGTAMEREKIKKPVTFTDVRERYIAGIGRD